MNTEANDNKIRFRYNIAKRIAFVSAGFFLILSILMIANFIQTQSVDPLNSKALNKLMLSLQENPNDTELKEQIRALDLLARKAFFTNRWQIKTGSYLLLVFALAFFTSLKSLSSLKRQFPDLTEKISDESSWENRFISKQYFAYGGIAIFILALFAGIFSDNIFEAGSDDTSIETENVNEIDIDIIRKNWPLI